MNLYNYIYIIAISLWVATFSGIPQSLKRFFKRKRYRPFDCALCLSAWITIGYELQHPSWNSVGIIAVVSIISSILESIKIRILGAKL